MVLKDEEGNLSFFVDPELRTIVESEDLAYFNPCWRISGNELNCILMRSSNSFPHSGSDCW